MLLYIFYRRFETLSYEQVAGMTYVWQTDGFYKCSYSYLTCLCSILFLIFYIFDSVAIVITFYFSLGVYYMDMFYCIYVSCICYSFLGYNICDSKITVGWYGWCADSSISNWLTIMQIFTCIYITILGIIIIIVNYKNTPFLPL